MKTINWAVGVTTVSSRLHTYLPRTLESLESVGFPEPWLFIDLLERDESFSTLIPRVSGITQRNPRSGSANLNNWTLGIWELWLRYPQADYYAIFEDDCLACGNLRRYLERTIRAVKPGERYWNLFSFDSNLADGRMEKPPGWYPAIEPGLSAMGLIFDRKVIRLLLESSHFVGGSRVIHRREKALDAVIKRAMVGAGVVEYVHNPSLLYHTGARDSSLAAGHNGLPQASTFPGEEYDTLQFLK